MTIQRILLCEYKNGDTEPTKDGLALLIGITTEEMLERWDPHSGIDSMPEEWKRRAQKRSLHARNATGSNITNVNLAYLAIRDWSARIDFDEAAGQQWAVLDDGRSDEVP